MHVRSANGRLRKPYGMKWLLNPFQIAQLEAAMREYGIKFRRV